MKSEALDVVIVSFRSRELLGRCLDSLREHPAPGGMTVTVVDNASGDGTAELVFAETQRGLAAGQVVALYEGDRLMGGGVLR